MVLPDSETLSQGEEESALQLDQEQKNHPFTSLGRQSSIYSLTLDEFQHTLCESGKSFGSMNMDEFLTSIWNAEENQAINSTNQSHGVNAISNQTQLTLNEATSSKLGIAKQPSLPIQASLTLPAPLCRKTVDEVWSEIHGVQQGEQQNCNDNANNSNSVQNSDAAPRQPTFGEMTLEDFLIKAGIVREHNPTPAPLPTQQQHFGVYQTNSNHPVMSPNFSSRPLLGMTGIGGGGSSSGVVGPAHQPMPPSRGVIGNESSAYSNVGSDKRSSGYSIKQSQPQQAQAQPRPAVCYSGRVGNGGAYGSAGQSMGVVPSVSPVSPEGLCSSQQVDSTANQYGMEMSGLRGKKRNIIDGPVEKVVERRQRRMIKNRESAARSRARKQAYTVELEAELNQLKEENAQLKQALVDMERKRKQQFFEELKTKAYTKGQKSQEDLTVLRRNRSGPL